MKFPSKFEEAQSLGEYEVISLGGHHLIIKHAMERTSSKGNPMIELTLETAPNDSQPDFCRKKYDRLPIQENAPKKWPQEGKYYVNVADKDGNTSPSFKNFVENVEKSNPGFIVPRGEFVLDLFKGKRIGAVYGPEMDYYNGKEYTRHKIFFFCDDGKVADVKTPKVRWTDAYKDYKAHASVGSADWSQMDDDLEGLPFN